MTSFSMDGLVESAAKLQSVVPDAVLIERTVASYYANHRNSYDHDHVLMGMNLAYDSILDAVESLQGWKTSERYSHPPMTIMGQLDGYYAGVRNLRRETPLETQVVLLPSGIELRIPTLDEALRIKAFMVVIRNAFRDYLDLAALSVTAGYNESVEVLSYIDDYYQERSQQKGSVRFALATQLCDATPKDSEDIEDLAQYKNLDSSWSWERVVEICNLLGEELL